MKNPDFCVLPFFGFENAEPGNAQNNIFCCRLPPDTDINIVRADILGNKRSAACGACWRLEDHGLTSERQLHNSALDFYWDKDITEIERLVHQGQHSSRIIKLNTSNICNGTCVTCGPEASSAWGQLLKQRHPYQQLLMSDLSHIAWPDITSLGFVGGEPLLEKTNFEILQHLLDVGNHRCFVHIVTNGSIGITDAQLDILSRFINLNICVSIDGIGPRFEYLRYPLRWETLLSNLERFRLITANISVSCMVSNISILYLDETLSWFESQQLRYLAKQIEEPGYFSPGNLPQSVRHDLMNATVWPKVMDAMLHCGDHDHQSWQKCWQELDLQDSLKNISIRDYLPRFASTRNV